MNELEQIFTPLKSLQAAEPNPYLATRVKAALAKRTAETPIEKLGKLLLKPAVLWAVILVVVAAQYAVFNQESVGTAEITEEVADNEIDMNTAFANYNLADNEK
jgi:hypothetical protein